MIGISVSAKKEWEVILDKFSINIENCDKFPFGEYFRTNLYGENILFYRCGVRKRIVLLLLNI